MVISALSRHDKYKNLSINFSDGSSVLTTDSIVAKHRLFVGKDLADDMYIALIKDSMISILVSWGERYFTKYRKTVSQAKNKIQDYLYKLQRNNLFPTEFDTTDILEKAILRLVELKFLDDKQYVEDFIDSFIKFHPASLYFLRMKLKMLAIDNELIEDVISKSGLTDEDLIQLVLQKKFHTSCINRQDSKKIRYLQSKGFSFDIISLYLCNE